MNPQSSRPSVALGAVPTAPKPAPNPITTNMPQFGSAPGLTNADGVPTLPPVSPGMTQPLTPAPNPTPAPAPVSAMPQYMNTASTNMIPVVNQPLDINKVPDTPAEQYNPFSSMPSGGQTTPKKSSGHTLNLLLGLLTALFMIAAIIFFVLWQNTTNTPKVVPMPTNPTPDQSTNDDNQPEDPDQSSNNPDQSASQTRHLSCRGATSELTETDLAAGVISNSMIYDVYYPESDPTDIRITLAAEYNSPEAAAVAHDGLASQNAEYLANVFAAAGIDAPSTDTALDGSTVSIAYVIPASQLTDQNLSLDARYMLVSATGFPSELSEDGATLTVYTDFDSVRARYESAGLVCEVIE